MLASNLNTTTFNLISSTTVVESPMYYPLLFTLAIFLGGSLLAPNVCELPETHSAKLHKLATVFHSRDVEKAKEVRKRHGRDVEEVRKRHLRGT